MLGTFNSKQLIWAAFFAALFVHAIILLTEVEPSNFRVDSSPQIRVQLLEIKEPQEKEREQAPTEDPIPQQDQPEPPSQNVETQNNDVKKTPEPEPEPATELITSSEQTKPSSVILVPSIHSKEFKQFLKSETDGEFSNNPNAAGEFADTFIAPAKPVIKDRKRETGPLDGGNYKVVKNGIECESLVATPQSLDEITGVVPLLSGKGRCRDLNKKIDLLDKDGKIKNSDRYDWN